MKGDVAASLNGARRLLRQERWGPEAFSPVLYLRDRHSVLFDFKSKRVKSPDTSRTQILDPALRELLQSKKFSLLLGDVGHDDHVGHEDRAGSGSHPEQAAVISSERASYHSAQQKLHRLLTEELTKREIPHSAKASLSAIAQHYALHLGKAEPDGPFQTVFRELVEAPTLDIPPLVDSLARLLRPGVHTTLLWLPILERAIAKHHPNIDIYVVQRVVGSKNPIMMLRKAKETIWSKPDRSSLKEFGKLTDLDRCIVILRPYGGYSALGNHLNAELTEDDHIRGAHLREGMFPRENPEIIMAGLRSAPVLLAGISPLQWRHRMLLLCLYPLSAPPGLALRISDEEPSEKELWENMLESLFGQLPPNYKFGVVDAAVDRLVPLLDKLPNP